jgi:hypothetical protein
MKKLFLTLSVLLLAVSGLAAIYVKQQGQSDKIYYVHCDHLGSILSLTDAIGGATSGYAEGFTSGLIMTGDIKEANKAGLNGLYSGAAIGTATGAMSGYRYAKSEGRNPWTGKEIKSSSNNNSLPTNYYPENDGFLGDTETKYLMPGDMVEQQINQGLYLHKGHLLNHAHYRLVQV